MGGNRNKYPLKCIGVFSLVAIIMIILCRYYLNSSSRWNNPIQFIEDKTFSDSHCQLKRDTAIDYRNISKLFYNRVRKCGSRTTLTLFAKLAKKNNWILDESMKPIVDSHWKRKRHFWTREESILQKYVATVMNINKPAVIQMHTHYIDFSRYVECGSPVYMNLVREPFSRLVSNYYYDFHKTLFKNEFTYDECVAKNMYKCVAPNPSGYFTLIPWFCGHDPICRYPNTAAIQRAKTNVEKYYPLIGLTEHYRLFLEALEMMFPQFFRDARTTYDSMSSHGRSRWNNTKRKTEPSEKTRIIMSKKLEEESEFYKFISKRFFDTYNKLHQKNAIE